MTREEIEAGRSEKGGFSRKTLAGWGIPWPPPKGWMEVLLAGKTLQEVGLPHLTPSPIRPNVNAHELLRQVVLAVVDRGHASDLYDYPDVVAYFDRETHSHTLPEEEPA